MKLVFFIDSLKVLGGGDYAQFKFAEHLALRGHEVIVFASNKYKFIEELTNLPNLKLRFRHELPRIFKGTGILNQLWDKIYTRIIVLPFIAKNSQNIDYLIGYLRRSAIKTVKIGKKYSIKTVNFIFENPNWMKRQIGNRFLDEYKGKFKESWENTKKAYLSTDILIPNSELTRKECYKWLKKRIEAPIYPGVSVLEIDAYEEYQVIYVGRLDEYKNVNEIIEAISVLKNPPMLMIIGTGEQKHKLKHLAKRLNVNCRFRKEVSDKEKFVEIKKSMFMVFSSSFEGFGIPPAESLACGKPCICSDIQILREVYKDKVEYFKEHDVKDLSKKIEFLIENISYRKKRGIEGRDYISSKYGWEKSAEKIERILSKYSK